MAFDAAKFKERLTASISGKPAEKEPEKKRPILSPIQIDKGSTQTSTPATSFPLLKPKDTSVQGTIDRSSTPAPQSRPPKEETISAGPEKSFFQKIIPRPVREGLFGRGQEVDIAGNLKVDRGAVGFFFPSFNRGSFEQVTERLDALKEAGISDERANEIAEVFGERGFTNQREKRLNELNLTDTEKSVLRKAKLIEGLNLALDIPFVPPIAKVVKVGGKTFTKVPNKSQFLKDRADELVRTDATVREIEDTVAREAAAKEAAQREFDDIVTQLNVKNADVLTQKKPDVKLQKIAQTSGNTEEFIKNTGITKRAVDTTVQRQGFKNADDFFIKNKNAPLVDVAERESLEKLAREAESVKRRDDLGDIFSSPEVSKRAAAVNDIRDTGKLTVEKEAIEQDRLAEELSREALEQNPARALQRFARKTGQERGTLPEVTGTGKGRFEREGDDIVTELGFKDSEEAREAFEEYLVLKERFERTQQAVRERTADFRDRKKILDLLKQQVNKEAAGRRQRIGAVQDFFKLSDAEMADIIKQTKFRDVRLLSEREFDEFMNALQAKSVENFELGQLRMELKAIIFERELIKTDNLRQVMQLPTITNMNGAQLEEFIGALRSFRLGDEFLTVRQLETLKHTDIADIKTVREAREKLAQEAGVPISQLKTDITPSVLDRFKFDTLLARRHPLYDVMVTEKMRAFLNAEDNFLRIKKNMNDLIGAARKSRKRGVLERAIPTDERIFRWLESDAIGKDQLSKEMTAEEIEAGMYIRNLYEQARDYLVQMQTLKRFKSDYITHIRRGFLEAWKEDGVMPAFREMFDQYKIDEANFNILDGKTGNVLPLEKFFQFSMRRHNVIKPSKNVARAVNTYMQTFERKVALDSLVPKIEIYAHSLTPRKLTPRGLEFDTSLKRFVKEWLNTKKGRARESFVTQGNPLDIGLRFGVAFTRILDLGLSIPTGLAASVGEQVVTLGAVGTKSYATGVARLKTKNGKKLLKNHENLIGESVWDRLNDASTNIGDKLSTGMFGLFSVASREANKVFLLSQATKRELQQGFIEPKRLAEIQKKMGKFRVVDNASSVFGSTPEFQAITQYKKWAAPILFSTIDNLTTLTKTLSKGEFKKAIQQEETQELIRFSITTSVIAIGLLQYSEALEKKKPEEKTFLDIIVEKAGRDSLTFIGALDPTVFTSEPRLLAFIGDLTTGLKQIALGEKFKSGEKEGTLKGDDKIVRTLTPSVVRHGEAIFGEREKEESSTLPELPQLPKLPKATVPALPKLPKF